MSSLDNTIRLLDKDSGELLNTLVLTHTAAAHALYYFSLCWIVRYKGHKGSEYKIDSALTHDDACVVSGSEDGKIYFWELVEVISVVREGGLCDWCVPTV